MRAKTLKRSWNEGRGVRQRWGVVVNLTDTRVSGVGQIAVCNHPPLEGGGSGGH